MAPELFARLYFEECSRHLDAFSKKHWPDRLTAPVIWSDLGVERRRAYIKAAKVLLAYLDAEHRAA